MVTPDSVMQSCLGLPSGCKCYHIWHLGWEWSPCITPEKVIYHWNGNTTRSAKTWYADHKSKCMKKKCNIKTLFPSYSELSCIECYFGEIYFKATSSSSQLAQLECLHSEDTPCRPMITHTNDSYWIPSQNKTKSKLQILRICQNFIFFCFEKSLYATHLLNLLDICNGSIQSGHNSVHRWTDRLPDRWKSVLHIWYKYQVKLDALHSAPTYICSHLLAVIFLDK